MVLGNETLLVPGGAMSDWDLQAGKYCDRVECYNLKVMSGPRRPVFPLTRSLSRKEGSHCTFWKAILFEFLKESVCLSCTDWKQSTLLLLFNLSMPGSVDTLLYTDSVIQFERATHALATISNTGTLRLGVSSRRGAKWWRDTFEI